MNDFIRNLCTHEVPIRLRNKSNGQCVGFPGKKDKDGDFYCEFVSPDDACAYFLIKDLTDEGTFQLYNLARYAYLFEGSNGQKYWGHNAGGARNWFSFSPVNSGCYWIHNVNYDNFMFNNLGAHKTYDDGNDFEILLPDQTFFTIENGLYASIGPLPDDELLDVLMDDDIKNDNSTELVSTRTFSKEYAFQHTWGGSKQIQDGISGSMSISIPFLDKLTGTLEFSHQQTIGATWGKQESEKTNIQDVVVLRVPPHYHVHASARIFQKRISIPFTADAIINYSSPHGSGQYKEHISGKFDGVLYSKFEKEVGLPQPM